MPVPFTNELRGPTRESQDDLLDLGTFALPDLKTVSEEAFNVPLPWPWLGKIMRGSRDLLHPGEHEDPAGVAVPIVAEQIPLTGNAGQMPGLDCPLFKSFGIKFLISEFDDLFILDCFRQFRKDRCIRQLGPNCRNEIAESKSSQLTLTLALPVAACSFWNAVRRGCSNAVPL